MNKKAIVTLELNKILADLSAYAAFSASQELLESLEPTNDIEVARLQQQKTTEALWKKFISGQTSNYPGLEKTVQNDMDDLFTRPDFEKIIENAVKNRLVIVKNNAKSLMKKLKEKNLAAVEELKGMDDIEIISKDPISITVMYPLRRI